MKLKATEKELLDPGWRRAGSSMDEAIPTGQRKLAALEIGQRVRPKKVRAEKCSGLDEAGLIRALREQGIGRPATYAMIVDTLLSRKYVEREPSGQMRLTQRGRDVCTFLLERYPDLFDQAFTAQMEAALDQIAEGKLSYEIGMMNVWRISSKK